MEDTLAYCLDNMDAGLESTSVSPSVAVSASIGTSDAGSVSPVLDVAVDVAVAVAVDVAVEVSMGADSSSAVPDPARCACCFLSFFSAFFLALSACLAAFLEWLDNPSPAAP